MKRANGASHPGRPTGKRTNDGAAGPSQSYQPSQKFRLEVVVNNLREYMGEDEDDAPDEVDGPIVIVGNLVWSLRAEVGHENGSDFLGVYLRCGNPGDGWRLMMDYTVSVVGRGVQKTERGVKISESSEDLAHFRRRSRTFKLEVDVTIYEPYRMLVDFFTADSNYNADVVLRVQERRFYVNKAYLGHQSDYFHQLFFGPLAQISREQVSLEDVDADGFLEFLGAIHRMRAPITDYNAEILIKLADRFQVVWLIGDCEEFLKESDTFTTVEKLVICTNVKLAELQKDCLDELTLEDVDELINMGKESAMGVKLDGRLLQELLGKQKELMLAKACARCRNKMS